MELKSTYTTFELENALHALNEVLKSQKKTVTVAVHRHPEDGSYSTKCTQEFINDLFNLAHEPCPKKVKLILVEYDTQGGLQVTSCGPEYLLTCIDRLRSEGYSPRTAKVVECYPTIQDIMDQEIIHKMIRTTEKHIALEAVNNILGDRLCQ